MGTRLGVDLGTTWTAAAIAAAGPAEALHLATHTVATPSVVAVGADGATLVGDAAERRVADDPASGTAPPTFSPAPPTAPTP